MTWQLGQIWIYPIKSLPGTAVKRAEILPAGNLMHDREFALFDADQRIVNGKRTAAFHHIRATWDLQSWTVALSTASETDAELFHLDHDRAKLVTWLSRCLELPVHLERQAEGGFPDDLEASGPTIVTTATLNAVAEWFPGLSLDEIRRRFRANLELAGGDAFSEDRLFAGVGEQIEFKVGNARLYGTNPCQRCVVPTRSSTTGEIWPLFQKTFAQKRQATLPSWADQSRFNHFYRLAVNTCNKVATTQTIHIDDPVQIL